MPEYDFAILRAGMEIILENSGQRILEYCPSFLKTDTMDLDVTSRFSRIPFKLHRVSIA